MLSRWPKRLERTRPGPTVSIQFMIDSSVFVCVWHWVNIYADDDEPSTNYDVLMANSSSVSCIRSPHTFFPFWSILNRTIFIFTANEIAKISLLKINYRTHKSVHYSAHISWAAQKRTRNSISCESMWQIPFRWRAEKTNLESSIYKTVSMDKWLGSSCSKWIKWRKMNFFFQIWNMHWNLRRQVLAWFLYPSTWNQDERICYNFAIIRVPHSLAPPCHSRRIEKAEIYFHNGEQIAATAQQTLLIHLQRGTVKPSGRSRTNKKENKVKSITWRMNRVYYVLATLSLSPPSCCPFSIYSITETDFEYQSRCSRH